MQQNCHLYRELQTTPETVINRISYMTKSLLFILMEGMPFPKIKTLFMINLGLRLLNVAACQQPSRVETVASLNKMLISVGIKHVYVTCCHWHPPTECSYTTQAVISFIKYVVFNVSCCTLQPFCVVSGTDMKVARVHRTQPAKHTPSCELISCC